MAICATCQQDIPSKQLLKHKWEKHRDEMMVQSDQAREKANQARAVKAGKAGENQPEAGAAATGSSTPGISSVPKGTVAKLTQATDPVDALILQFLTQTQYPVPNTPAIMIPYILAVKSGFPSDFGTWLGEVSTRFWYDRGIDPFKEVHYGSGAGQGDEELVQQSAAEQPN